MTIRVTAEDIAAGVCGDPYHCPVACALARELDTPRVDPRSISFGAHTHRLATNTPPSVAAFVRAFDAGKPVEPFAFELEGV